MYMQRYFFIYSLLASAMLSFSCNKETSRPDPVVPADTLTYEQYGVPFEEVAEAADVIMYEVNLRALSPAPNLQGVIDKLDHIRSLGVNVLWLMPIYPIGTVNSVNSPYSVKDYKAVNPELGDLEDLRRLTDGAHARGMAVILDWVANHTAWDHPWISNKDWYTQDANGNIIHPPGTNWLDVADLNFSNQDMRNAMIDAMKYWLYEANVDGFRCDYADGVPQDFWKQAWDEIGAIPDRNFVLFAEGSRKDHFSAGFQLAFGWEFYGALKQVYNGQPVSRIFTAHANEYQNTANGKHWIRFTTNHDESAWDASPVSIFKGIDGALAASVVTIFTGGAPLIYGSQEVGTPHTIPFFSTSAIDWNANPAMLAAYRQLLQFYAASSASKYGELTVFPHNDVAAFSKKYLTEEVLVLVNLRSTPNNFVFPAALQGSQWVDVFTGNTIDLDESLALQAWEYLILER
jgi:glycosidase